MDTNYNFSGDNLGDNLGDNVQENNVNESLTLGGSMKFDDNTALFGLNRMPQAEVNDTMWGVSKAASTPDYFQNDDGSIGFTKPITVNSHVERFMFNQSELGHPIDKDSVGQAVQDICIDIYTGENTKDLDDGDKKKLIKELIDSKNLPSLVLSDPSDPSFDPNIAWENMIDKNISYAKTVTKQGFLNRAKAMRQIVAENPSIFTANKEYVEQLKAFGRKMYDKTLINELKDFDFDPQNNDDPVAKAMEEALLRETCMLAAEKMQAWEKENPELKENFVKKEEATRKFLSESLASSMEIISSNPNRFGFAFEAARIARQNNSARLWHSKAQESIAMFKGIKEAEAADKKVADEIKASEEAKEKLEKQVETQKKESAQLQQNPELALELERAKAQEKAIRGAAQKQVELENKQEKEQGEWANYKFKDRTSTRLDVGLMKNFRKSENPDNPNEAPPAVLGVPASLYEKIANDLGVEKGGAIVAYVGKTRMEVRVAKGISSPRYNVTAFNRIHKSLGRAKQLTKSDIEERVKGYPQSVFFEKVEPKNTNK